MDQGQGVGGCPICDANLGHHWTRSQIADLIATFVMEEWYNGDLPPGLQIVMIFEEDDVYITWPDGAGTGLPQPVLPQLPQEHASEEGEDEIWTTETAMVSSPWGAQCCNLVHRFTENTQLLFEIVSYGSMVVHLGHSEKYLKNI